MAVNAAILLDDKPLVFVVALGFRNEGLDEFDAEETKKVDEGGDECEDGGEFGEGEKVERGGVVDLLAPTVEEEVGDREKEREENSVG